MTAPANWHTARRTAYYETPATALAAMGALGTVDRLGYLWCLPCAVEYDKVGMPVTGAPHDSEPCEGCKRILKEVSR